MVETVYRILKNSCSSKGFCRKIIWKVIANSFGPNILNLTVARTYLSTLLSNVRVVKYIAQHHPEYLTEFQKITEITSLGGGDAAL
jgi:hypothetical protein